MTTGQNSSLGKYDMAAIFPAVGYPPQMLWVPRRWFAAETVLGLVTSTVAGALNGGFPMPEIGLPLVLMIHAYGAWRYMKDPFFLDVMIVKFQGRPVPAITPTKSVRRLPAGRHVFY